MTADRVSLRLLLGVTTHRARTFKTVAVIGHAAQSAVFDAAAGAGWFQSGIGHVVVNEVFHPRAPWVFVADTAPAVGDSVQFLCAGHRLQRDVDVSFLFHVDVVCV